MFLSSTEEKKTVLVCDMTRFCQAIYFAYLVMPVVTGLQFTQMTEDGN